MNKKIKIAVVGLGKMGLSHFALVNAHQDTETIACDAAGFLTDVLSKNITNKIYKRYDEMLDQVSFVLRYRSKKRAADTRTRMPVQLGSANGIG